jgi:tetratricopeptide (TPR) repeat protein
MLSTRRDRVTGLSRSQYALGREKTPRPLSGLLVILAGFFLTGCPPRVVRVPVPTENVIRGNEAAREADLAFARRDYYAALIKYLEAGRHNPNSEYIYNKLGITYSQLKFYREATDAFLRSIGLNSKYPYSYNNLGSVYFATNDKRAAERHFKKAISLNPNVASFHINLGTLYFERKKLKLGMEEWRKGLALDPGILSNSGGVSLVAAGTKTSSPDKSYFIARLYASMGDAKQAVENLQQALNAGFADINAIHKEPDFDPIRQDDRFRAFMRTAVLLTRP